MTTRGDSPSARMLPAERRSVTLIALVSMCRLFGLFALLPVLALYSAGLEGATPLLIGVAVGGYGLTQAALQIPFGAASDRLGRVPVLLFGLAVFAAGSVVAAESATIGGVIVGRLLQGAGAVSATLTALLADSTRAEVRTRSMAFFGIGVGLAFLLALIGGPLIAAALGVRALFWVAAALAGVGALLLVALPPRAAGQHTSARTSLTAILRPPLLALDLYALVLHTLLTATFVALPFLLEQQLGLPLARHWPVYAGALALSLAGTVPLIVVDDRRGKAATLGTAVVLVLAGELALGFAADGRVTVVVALALFFAGFNFMEAGLPARLSLAADGSQRGAALGLFSSCQFAGAFAGGLLGGHFLAGGRPGVVFTACALLAGLWLAFLKLGPDPANSRQSA